jgi:hypothetical protein
MHTLLPHHAAGVPPSKLAVVFGTFEVPKARGVLANARQVLPAFHAITHEVVQDIANVRRARNSSIDVAVMFLRLLASIRLLVTAADPFLKREAAAVLLPNLMRHLPENAHQARFIFQQRHVAAELRQVSLCRLLL